MRTKEHDNCHMHWSSIYHSHVSVAKGYWRLLGSSGVFFHPSGMERGDATPEARVERGRRMGICEFTLNGPWQLVLETHIFQKHPDPPAKYTGHWL